MAVYSSRVVVGRFVSRALVCVFTAVCLPGWAAPEPYSRVYLETSIASAPTAHTEIERLEQAVLTLDVAGESVEIGASSGFESIRAFDLSDASADGASFLTQMSSGDNGCDGAPPCPQPLSITNGYLTLADQSALFRPKALLSPGNEFLAGVQGAEGRAQGEESFVAFEVLVAKPTSLTAASLSGTYRFAVLNHELDRDVIGGTTETGSVSELTLTFNGDGTCSGGLQAGGEAEQVSEWPMLDSRGSVFAALEAAAAFASCSYTTDNATGTATVVLEISDGGDTFTQSVDLFVSSQGRYLAGRLAVDTDEGISVGSELSTFVAARIGASALTNADLVGTYFMSTMGETLSGADALGLDSDFVTRAVLTFESGAADAEGFNACSVVGRSYAGSLRSLGGSVPSPSSSTVVFSGDATVNINDCRFRVDSASSLTLELSAQGVATQVSLGVSDDQQTLLGTQLSTSEDPLPEGINVELLVPSVATTELFVLQRYSGAATDAAANDFAAPIVPALDPTVQLAASVLPGSRSVETGQVATAFASVINFGTGDGVGCDIRYAGNRSLNFSYQETLPNNAPTGEQNGPVSIASGATQTFFFSITPFEEFSSEEIELDFSCLNAGSALPVIGLNTLLLSATGSPGPDVIALGATVSNDGIARLSGAGLSGFFSLASSNVGVSDSMMVSVDTGAADLPLVASICETNPMTGACVNPTTPSSAPVSLTIGAGATPTFAVFLAASEAIALDPANKRVFVRFSDSTGVVRGSTSVAVQTE